MGAAVDDVVNSTAKELDVGALVVLVGSDVVLWVVWAVVEDVDVVTIAGAGVEQGLKLCIASAQDDKDEYIVQVASVTEKNIERKQHTKTNNDQAAAKHEPRCAQK